MGTQDDQLCMAWTMQAYSLSLLACAAAKTTALTVTGRYASSFGIDPTNLLPRIRIWMPKPLVPDKTLLS